MKKLNIPMLLLAILVILMFCLVGVAMSYQNIWFILLFLLLGFGLMGFGLYLKNKRPE